MIEFQEADLRTSHHLVVAFAGVLKGYGGLPFELVRTLNGVQCAALFVRDLGQHWYQYSEEETQRAVAKVRLAMDQTGARHLTMVGNSMGGFAAFMFGSLCKADRILAFVPQSAIEPGLMHRLGDHRYDQWTDKIEAFPHGDLLDMKPSGRAMIYVGDQEPIDAVHARRIANHWKCGMQYISDVGHAELATRMRERGILQRLMQS